MICISKLTIIGPDNGLSPGRCQAIIWTLVGILLIRTFGTNFSEILCEIHTFSSKKMYLKMPSAKWRQFCVLTLDILYSFRERQKWFWFCTSSRHWHHVGNHPGVDKNRSKQLYIVRIRFTDLIWRRIGAPAGQVLKELHEIFDNRNGNQLRSVSPWIVDMINNHSHRNVSPWSFLSNWFMLIKSIINKTELVCFQE